MTIIAPRVHPLPPTDDAETPAPFDFTDEERRLVNEGKLMQAAQKVRYRLVLPLGEATAIVQQHAPQVAPVKTLEQRVAELEEHVAELVAWRRERVLRGDES